MDLGLAARAAVNTGEAVVTLGGAAGERAGDRGRRQYRVAAADPPRRLAA